MPDGSVGGVLPGPIGPYRVEGVLGQGAMSVVYRATDGRTGQPVALKLLRSELLAAAERNAVLARFGREAEIGLKLDHRNIVRVHDYGMLDAAHGGAPYLAMELIQGRELKQYLEADTPLSVQQGGELMAAVLDALAFAHARNIIHRDIKPANIVVEDDLTPKLADFGIAHMSSSTSSSDLTQAGDLLGTPAYMAPEVLRGEKADARSDLFSAGVVLYYLLAQRRPFSGSVATVMQQILFVEPPPPSHGNPELPPPFDTMILKALAKAPADRYASAAEFAQALRHALAVAGTMRAAMPSAELTLFNAELPAAAAPARDREALAAALETALRAIPGQPIDARKLTELLDILAEWQAGTGGDAQRWQSVLLGAGIEPLTELIVAATPAPRAAPTSQRRDWMPLVRLLAAMNRALAGTPAADRARMSAARIAFDLSGRFFLYSGELNRVLMDGDNPDIQMLSLDFLRLEILQHALEELGAEAELAQSRSAMLMFAVQVIRKVTQILRACTDGNDGLARFGVAIILANIEELIVMAQRLFETGGQATGGLPQDAVAEFISAAGRFATLSVEELRGEVAQGSLAGAGTAESFGARLRGVGQLYLFATRLTAPDCAPLMHSLSTMLYGLVAGLTADLGNAPVSDTGARTRLVALAEMANGLGWSEVERIAVTALRRWAVAGAAA